MDDERTWCGIALRADSGERATMLRQTNMHDEEVRFWVSTSVFQMEKLTGSYDRECLKMAMLKHEETFKEQVCELHRLYRIQKVMMKTIGNSFPNKGNPTNLTGQINTRVHQLQKGVHPAGDLNDGLKGDGALFTIEESQIELTLAPSTYSTSTSRSKKDTAPLSSSSFSSSSTGSSQSEAGATVKEGHLLKIKCQSHPPWIHQLLSLNST
ncbi:hypothetical protein SAY87_009126 [Trapa incisa]|uniref:Uncharacterized protein n=2 Tax=Trapa TaxID=22665 RepID=A0AAN7MSX6_TRANT|nr:hypothetical protein SAY87_009126 [Trapa incisa]KAK4798503.1 hypothetical protein SAY86_030829 [Trapa natans]